MKASITSKDYDPMRALAEEERKRRRFRLALSLPAVLGVLLFGIGATIFPTVFYNIFHERPLKPGQSSIVFGLDVKGGARITYSARSDPRLSDTENLEALRETQDLLRKRISTFGNLEPNVAIDEARRLIIVELPGVENREAIAGVIGGTGQMQLVIVSEMPGTEISVGQPIDSKRIEESIAGKSDISETLIEERSGFPRSVIITFKPAKQKQIIARLAANRGRQAAITISGIVRKLLTVSENFGSGPNSASGGGSIEITSTGDEDLSPEEAMQYKYLLEWASLPIELDTQESTLLSSAMGEEQLAAAFGALLLGAILVAAVLIILYGTYLGTVGCIALLYCGILTWGIFSTLGLVITLAGLAGFLLDLGLCVDSFILVFEAIKDEIRRRAKLRLEAFDEDSVWDELKRVTKHLTALRITTASGALVLLFWEGPVRSFAISLLVGMVAEWIVASRPVLGGLLILFIGHGSKVNRFTYGIPVFRNYFFDRFALALFAKKRLIARVALLGAVLSVILLVLAPPPLGLDFAGGVQVQLSLPVSCDEDLLFRLIEDAGVRSKLISMQHGLLATEFNERIWILSFDKSAGPGEVMAAALGEALEKNKIKGNIKGVTELGPRVKVRLLANWCATAGLALLITMAYCLTPWSGVSLFGKKLQPTVLIGAGAIYDIIVVLGVLCVLQIELDMPTVTALLVLLGYTLNDSLIFLWHLEEKVGAIASTAEMPENIIAVTAEEVRSRTLATVTTLMAGVLPILLFAGNSFLGYAVVTLSGVIIGTFSTFFVVGYFADKVIRHSRQLDLPADASEISI